MDYIIIIGLIILGIIFFLMEVFLIPGINIAAIASGCSMIYACYYAFTELGTTQGYITLFAVIILSIGALIWFMRSRTLDKLSLKKEIHSTIENKVEQSIQVGDQGTAITRLALIGMADFNNQTVEVKSIDGFIDEHTPIVVTRIEEGVIMVKRNH